MLLKIPVLDSCTKLSILKDPEHAVYEEFKLLPHRHRFRLLVCKTNRRGNSFIHTAVQLLSRGSVMDNLHCHGRAIQFVHGDVEPMEVDDEYFHGTGLPDAVGAQAAGVEKGTYGGRVEASTIQDLQHKDIPDHWSKMESGTAVAAVWVHPNTQEYIRVAFDFMSAMTVPDTEVIGIFRIQNPFLWKHYVLKRQEMQHENKGKEVLEKRLFHGTKCANIDAICRKGFDWRICGRHGTKYGQGCYFARDSKYSHMYSPRSCDPRDHCDLLQSAIISVQAVSHLGDFANSPCDSSSDFGASFGHTFSSTLQRDGHTALLDSGFNTLPSVYAHYSRPAQTSNPTFLPGQSPTQLPLPFGPSPPPHQPANCCHSSPLQATLCSYQPFSTHIASPSSHPVTTEWPQGFRYMFLARVLVGDTVQGHTDYRRPPAFDPGNPLSRCYDSCVDSMQDPRIFVVFDSNQAYPEYIVKYKYYGKEYP